ncbi:MAG: NUDIX domain-containing protein [Bacilli bacterium]
MEETIDILNKSGEKLGYAKFRKDQLEKNEYALVIHLWIQTSDGQFLVQQRSSNKKVDPLKWSTVAGFVMEDEDSFSTIKRELEEELGYIPKTVNYNFFKRFFPKDGIQHIADVYFLYEDISLDEVMLQAEEVAGVKILTKEEIRKQVELGVFNNFDDMYDNYYSQIFREN